MACGCCVAGLFWGVALTSVGLAVGALEAPLVTVGLAGVAAGALCAPVLAGATVDLADALFALVLAGAGAAPALVLPLDFLMVRATSSGV